MRYDLDAVGTYTRDIRNPETFKHMIQELVTSYGTSILPTPCSITIRFAEYFLHREELLEDSGICLYEQQKRLTIRISI